MFVVSLLVGIVPVLWRVRHSCSCWCLPVRCHIRWRRRWGQCWHVCCSRWYCPGTGNGSFAGVVVRIVGEAASAAAIHPLVVGQDGRGAVVAVAVVVAVVVVVAVAGVHVAASWLG